VIRFRHLSVLNGLLSLPGQARQRFQGLLPQGTLIVILVVIVQAVPLVEERGMEKAAEGICVKGAVRCGPEPAGEKRSGVGSAGRTGCPSVGCIGI
jgi:hypothetical protein